MAPMLGVEMMRSMQEDRLQRAERDRIAHRARKARRQGASVKASDEASGLRAPATIPALQRLAHVTSAVKVGDVIEVGGVAALGEDGRVRFLGDAYEQTRQALRVLGETLARFGAGMDDVVRTRVYLKKSWQWEEVSRAHGEVFRQTSPVTTFVGAGGFPDSDMLVAIEATAVVR